MCNSIPLSTYTKLVLIYLHKEKYLFSWKKIFIYVNKNIFFHENNLEESVFEENKQVYNL